mmetsp:Transcript_46158/g.93170  ORF Transcript_46158/g.93170 Transcript_46158/m.93170 type:complete len:262 (-) Transcript_46158:994-1779(-)
MLLVHALLLCVTFLIHALLLPPELLLLLLRHRQERSILHFHDKFRRFAEVRVHELHLVVQVFHEPRSSILDHEHGVVLLRDAHACGGHVVPGQLRRGHHLSLKLVAPPLHVVDLRNVAPVRFQLVWLPRELWDVVLVDVRQVDGDDNGLNFDRHLPVVELRHRFISVVGELEFFGVPATALCVYSNVDLGRHTPVPLGEARVEVDVEKADLDFAFHLGLDFLNIARILEAVGNLAKRHSAKCDSTHELTALIGQEICHVPR